MKRQAVSKLHGVKTQVTVLFKKDTSLQLSCTSTKRTVKFISLGEIRQELEAY
jgi:hypothetical protein